LRSTFKSLPKNEQGRLQHAGVRYTLHRYFVQRHAWFVRGLASLGDDSNASSPTNILQDKVEEFVQGAFEQRMGSNGLDLKDLAVLAATYENLVHKEMSQKLDATFQMMSMTGQESMTLTVVDTVLDVYMMGYILNLNYTVLRPYQLKTITERVGKAYPTWSDTKAFLREVRAGSSLHRSYFSRSDVEDILEEVFDQYGRWQNRECQDLKYQMLALEDRSIGVNGSGRVRLTDFYGSAVRDGNWQFSETTDYLSLGGALDRHGSERVIIANYINSPSNCLASSKFYSVCCINECEDLLDHIEHHFAEPTAKPADIAEFVTAMSSSSVSAGRTLPNTLVQRLDEIALRYDGQVPLHSRLFAQWMHHAYPRECPYPHMSGTTRPLTAQDYKVESQRSPVLTADELKQIVQAVKSESDQAESDECTEWSHLEELYVGDHRMDPATGVGQGVVWQFLRPFVFLSAALATLGVLAQRSSCVAGSKKSAGGKDLFV